MKKLFSIKPFCSLLTPALLGLSLLSTHTLASVVMVDFGEPSSLFVADANDLGIDSVVSKSEVDANGAAFNVSVGGETLTVDLVDDDGAFISRDRGTTHFTDDSSSDILSPYVRDNVLASDDDMDIIIGGLTIGNSYEFGFYGVDLYSSNFNTANTMTVVGDASFGTVGSVTWNNGGTGTTYTTMATNLISTGTFVAGSTSETFTITGSAGAPRGTIQALTITVIPEPSTLILLGMTFGAMMVFRRRP